MLKMPGSMHASMQMPVRCQSPHSVGSAGRSPHILHKTREGAPEIAEIDARLQALQAFLKTARVDNDQM